LPATDRRNAGTNIGSRSRSVTDRLQCVVGRGWRAWLEGYAARRDGLAAVLVSWAFMAAVALTGTLAVALHAAALGWVAALLFIPLCWRKWFRGHW
jgi:hypothetical protein